MGAPVRVGTVIVGAGQAGLATAKALIDRGLTCVVFERNSRVGDEWRRHYDSLRLFTPARYDSLPGVPFPGDPHGYPTKEEVADYLEDYSAHFRLPVRTGIRVTRVSPGEQGRFLVETDVGAYSSSAVVVATGTYGRTPRIPPAAAGIDPSIEQLHSSQYRRPSQIAEGPVLVVGASHSGCDIAYELAASRPTVLVGRSPGEIPLRWGSRALRLAWPLAIFAGRHLLTRGNPLGRRLMAPTRAHGSPMLRVKRSDLAARNVIHVEGRVVGARDGRPLVDDGRVLDVRTVVWATGFEQRLEWIDFPVLDRHGWPREFRGVVAEVPGLYFCGLAFQRSFASGDLAGVAADARYLAGRISRRGDL